MPEAAEKKTRVRRSAVVVQKHEKDDVWDDLASYASAAAADKWIATEAPEGVYRVASVWPAVTVAVEEKPVRLVKLAD